MEQDVKTSSLDTLRAITGIAALIALTGCSAIPSGKWRDAATPANFSSRSAGPVEQPAAHSSAEDLSSEPAGDPINQLGARVAAATKCGLKGAAGPLRMLLVPLGGLIALPLIPVGAVMGTVEGAYKGWCL